MTTKENTPIVQDGDPVLRAIATRVPLSDIGTKELNNILTHMNKALDRESDGVAIAAPQIGVSLSIFIVSHKAFEIENAEEGAHEVAPVSTKNMVVINPEIIKVSKKMKTVPEGCLSVRWFYGNTRRHEKVTIRAYDENGKAFTYGGSGLVAQIFQHETDHLKGILFNDHATDLEELTKEQIAEIEKRNGN